MKYTTLISPPVLHDLAGAVVIVDMRFSLADPEKGRQDYLHSHLPGAVYAHLDEDLCGPVIPGVTGRHPLPRVEDFVRRLEAWGISNGTQVVVYDDASGGYAARLWWMLNWVGHSAVAVLDGGWQAWVAQGWPVIDTIPTLKPGRFTPRLHPELVVTAAEVERMCADPSARVLDARLPIRFRGEQEPIDPVAGHIPGAMNAPFPAALKPDGTFMEPEALKAYFQGLLGEIPASRVAHYCGSGVTAASNILAMAHAGLGMSRLYAGSWSEWITDPNRPVAREVRSGS